MISFLRSKKIWVLCIIVVLIIVVYWPSLGADFVNWDDDVHLLNNPFITSLNPQSLKEIFFTTINDTYVPLTSLSFALEYKLFGFVPFIYHLNNILLHIFVTILLYLFLLKIGLSKMLSLGASLIFGVHPMHVESVAWVTERKDVLFAFFYMLSINAYCNYIFFIEHNVSKKMFNKKYMYVLLFVILSVLAKPTALSLVLIFFILDIFLRRKYEFKMFFDKVPVIALTTPVVFMSYFIHARNIELNLYRTPLIWIWSLVFYLKKFFYPDYYALFYDLPAPISISNQQYMFSVILFLLLLISIVLLRKNRYFVFGITFFFASIFFFIRFDCLDYRNIVADRYIYIPSIGLCIAVVGLIDALLRIGDSALFRRIGRCPLFFIFVSVISILSLKSYKQSFVWTNSINLWENQMNSGSNVAKDLVYSKLADAYFENLDAGDNISVNKIVAYYEKSIKINPMAENAYYGLGLLRLKLGERAMARNLFARTIDVDPEHFDAYYQLGVLSFESGDFKLAQKYFKIAIDVNPDNGALCSKIYEFLRSHDKVNNHDSYDNCISRKCKCVEARKFSFLKI